MFVLIPACTTQDDNGSFKMKIYSYLTKMKQLLLIFLLSICGSLLFAQKEEAKKRRHVLEEYGLKRNALDFYLAGGLATSAKNHEGIFSTNKEIHTRYLGTGIRFSSNWYFNIENQHRWYFRTNWLTSGISYIKHEGLPFANAPLNIGIGDNIQLSENINLDLAISGGLFILGPGPMGGSVDFFGIVYPEVKVQTKWITISLIYSRYVNRYPLGKSIYNTLLLGLSSSI